MSNLTPEYLHLLKEATTPKASDYFAGLLTPDAPKVPAEHPVLAEAHALIQEGQPKERVIRALERLDIEDKETLINKLNESSGDR